MPYKEFFKENQKTIIRLFLFLGALLYFLHATGSFPYLNLEWTNAINFSILTFVLYRIVVNTMRDRPYEVYENQTALTAAIIKALSDKKIEQAYVIQYSSRRAVDIIRHLVENGANVTLWVHDQETAISEEQKRRIEESVLGLPGDIEPPDDVNKRFGHLTVYKYYPPATIRGMLIDDKLLVIGWYTYEHKLKLKPNYPNDKFEISGHDRPSLVYRRGTPEFKHFRQMFLDQIDNYEKFREKEKETFLLEIGRPKITLESPPN